MIVNSLIFTKYESTTNLMKNKFNGRKYYIYDDIFILFNMDKY